MEKKFRCHKISEGIVEGEALVSGDNIMFYLIEPDTGKVIEPAHALEGQSIANKILIFPSGKGSSVVQADGLFQLNKKDNAPKGMIIRYPETCLLYTSPWVHNALGRQPSYLFFPGILCVWILHIFPSPH